MKKLYFSFLLMLLPLMASAQVKRTINVETAGTLPSLISEEEKYTIEELTLTGNLNGTDFRLLRDMAGNNYKGEKTPGKLYYLDISGAKIVAGGVSYLETSIINYEGGSYGFGNEIVSLFINKDNTFPRHVFNGCLLTSICLPTIIGLDDYAFANCIRLTSFVVPEGIMTIGEAAFIFCRQLKCLELPSTLTWIGDNVISGCKELETVISHLQAPFHIDNIVFCDYSTENPTIDIPSPATLYVPFGTKAKYLDAGGWKEFANIVEMGLEKDGIYYKKINNQEVEVISNPLKYFGNIVIPEKVTFDGIEYNVNAIGSYAFENCTDLKSVSIPNSVSSIGDLAFLSCKGLTSLLIPKGVTSIGQFSFQGCSGLTTLTIPQNVVNIERGAFASCTNLRSIVVEEGNPNYDSRSNCNAIMETSTNTLIAGCNNTIIPKTTTSIGKEAFQSCEFVSINIPNGVTSIGSGAFVWCNNLERVLIPSSVTTIDDWAFTDCSGLESVTSLAQTPPEMKDNSFSNYDIPLYVPKGTRDAYLAQEPWNKFKEIVEIDNTDEDEITIKEIGKTTWCSEYDLDFTNVEGIKAYTATGYNNITKTIWLTRVMEVPAGTGILVKGDAGIYKIPHAKVQSAYANWFVGNLGATISIAATDGDKTNYYLSGKDGSFVSVNGSANIGTNKAYLQLPTSIFAGTRTIGISYDDEDGTTGIREAKQSKEDGAYYTLQGQRVVNPGKGLYIHNGKKVVIK